MAFKIGFHRIINFKTSLFQFLHIFIVLGLISSATASPVPVPIQKGSTKPKYIPNLPLDTHKPKPNNDIMKGMDEFFKTYGPAFRKDDKTGGLIPNPGSRFGTTLQDVGEKQERRRKSSKGHHKRRGKKSHRREDRHKRKHIGKVPQRETFRFGDPPSGLMDDQRKSAEYYDDSVESQKQAFEAYLNSHEKHRKRSKEISDQHYMTLNYDHQNKKYSMTENSDE